MLNRFRMSHHSSNKWSFWWPFGDSSSSSQNKWENFLAHKMTSLRRVWDFILYTLWNLLLRNRKWKSWEVWSLCEIIFKMFSAHLHISPSQDIMVLNAYASEKVFFLNVEAHLRAKDADLYLTMWLCILRCDFIPNLKLWDIGLFHKSFFLKKRTVEMRAYWFLYHFCYLLERQFEGSTKNLLTLVWRSCLGWCGMILVSCLNNCQNRCGLATL